MDKVKVLWKKAVEKVKSLNKQQKIILAIIIIVILGSVGYGIFEYYDHQAYLKVIEREENHEEKLKETIKESMIWRATAKYGKISNLYLTEYKKVGIDYYIKGYAIVDGKKKYFDAKFVAPGTKNNGLFDYMDYANWDD